MSLRPELNPSNFKSMICSVEKIFDDSVANLFGLVIPDYQRDYTWEEPEIKRLVSDILASIAVRSKKPSGNFFGATVWCKRLRTIETEFNIPSYDIVDGQQRITSCLLLTICVCLKIHENYAELVKNVVLAPKLKTWLEDENDYVERQALDMVVGELRKSAQPFPMLIHEEDIRGKSVGASEYNSPLALIQLAFEKAVDAKETKINFDDIKVNEKYENVFERLKTNISYFNKCLDELTDEKFFNSLSIEFTDKSLLGAKNLKDLLLGGNIPQSEYDKALADEDLFEKQIRLLQFCGHFFKASCFSLIITDDEDAAFSIFDSLNTTGVPLTAIETLKPYIMREYKNEREKFDGSVAEKNLEIVDGIVRAPSNNMEKQSKISKELTIHSALLLDKNTTLNNDLNAQRIALREIQRECSDAKQKHLTSEVLKNVAEYRQDFTFIENIRNFQNGKLNQNETSEVKLINSFLANTGTKLYRPILTRFYYDKTGIVQYHKICKALAAFYVLRRATSNDTDRIDDIFRSCMKGTETFQGLNLNCNAPIALTNKDFIDFKNHLKGLLSTNQLDFNIHSKKKWVDHVKEMTHFKGAKFLLRFMLFAAHDGAKIDKADNTLLQRDDASPDSSTEFLNFSTWDDGIYETLEHIAPQNEKSSGWKGVYDDPKIKDMIGNFILLPKGQNSALQDVGWDIKKLFLQTLLCDSESDRKNLVSTGKVNGIKLPPSIEKRLLSGELVKSHMLIGLDNVSNWDADYIKKRSERLVSLAWDKMILWLS